MQANMHEAKSKLSQLVDAVLEGEEVIIAKSGMPVARLIPYEPNSERQIGMFAGEISMSENFDSKETNAEVAELFGVK